MFGVGDLIWPISESWILGFDHLDPESEPFQGVVTGFGSVWEGARHRDYGTCGTLGFQMSENVWRRLCPITLLELEDISCITNTGALVLSH